VLRDSVQLAFLIARLNDLDELAGDVTNTFLNAKWRKKIWFEGGIKTGEDKGKVLIVTRALYGLKLSGITRQADLAAMLQDLKFTSTQADPDVWIQSGGMHHDMVLVYNDDILIFAKDPKMTMDKLGKQYELKPKSEEFKLQFLQLVGIFRWVITKLGRLDIYVELSQLSQHQTLPRRGHLEVIYHIFAYLKKHKNGARMVFDPN
jgi:hypothetical protein